MPGLVEAPHLRRTCVEWDINIVVVQAKGGVSAWVVDEDNGTLSMRKAEADGRGSQAGDKAAPPPFSVGVDHVFGPQRDTEAVFQATARVRPSLHFLLSLSHTLGSEAVSTESHAQKRLRLRAGAVRLGAVSEEVSGAALRYAGGAPPGVG